jgi:hypothetical protein
MNGESSTTRVLTLNGIGRGPRFSRPCRQNMAGRVKAIHVAEVGAPLFHNSGLTKWPGLRGFGFRGGGLGAIVMSESN